MIYDSFIKYFRVLVVGVFVAGVSGCYSSKAVLPAGHDTKKWVISSVQAKPDQQELKELKDKAGPWAGLSGGNLKGGSFWSSSKSTTSNHDNGSHFATAPINLQYPKMAVRKDDVAVVIANAHYSKYSQDIPNVLPAYADAEGFKRYLVEGLGVLPDNIIFLRDATAAGLSKIFGTKGNHQGQLFNWIKPGESNVTVYYVGHGAPSTNGKNAYLVPTDASISEINLTGYSLDTLYENLNKLSAKSMTVVLETCFSGLSDAGSLIQNASPIFVKPKNMNVPKKFTVFAAGAADQIASWEKNKRHSIFTKHFLLGMSGQADGKPFGDDDGNVTKGELARYLKDKVGYLARRYYGRVQTPQIIVAQSR
jgi:hypothetical protein